MWLTASHSRSSSSLVCMDEISNPFILVLAFDQCAPLFYMLDAFQGRARLLPSHAVRLGGSLALSSLSSGVSVLRPTRIDILIPQRNPACHAFYILESGLLERFG